MCHVRLYGYAPIVFPDSIYRPRSSVFCSPGAQCLFSAYSTRRHPCLGAGAPARAADPRGPGCPRPDQHPHPDAPIPGGNRPRPAAVAPASAHDPRPGTPGDHGPDHGPGRPAQRAGHDGLAAPAHGPVDRTDAERLPRRPDGRGTGCDRLIDDLGRRVAIVRVDHPATRTPSAASESVRPSAIHQEPERQNSCAPAPVARRAPSARVGSRPPHARGPAGVSRVRVMPGTTCLRMPTAGTRR